MADPDQQLGVNLYHLWWAGTRGLPLVAERFALARRPLAITESQDGVFWRSAELCGGGHGPAGEAFFLLRDTMISVLSDMQSNLEVAAEALQVSAQEYAGTDERVRAAFLAAKSGGS